MHGPLSRPHPSVLLAEADPVAAYVLQHELTHLGAAVRVAPCGRSALDHLAEQVLTTDLLVVGLALPPVDGADLIRTIRRRGGEHDLPILAVGSGVTLAMEASLHAHGVAVVDHDAGPGAIAAEAQRLLEERGWHRWRTSRLSDVDLRPAAPRR